MSTFQSNSRGKTVNNAPRIKESFLLFVLMMFYGIAKAQTVEPFTFSFDSGSYDDGDEWKTYICKQNNEKEGCKIDIKLVIIYGDYYYYDDVFFPDFGDGELDDRVITMELNLSYAKHDYIVSHHKNVLFPTEKKTKALLSLTFDNGTILHNQVNVERLGQLVVIKTNEYGYYENKSGDIFSSDFWQKIEKNNLTEISLGYLVDDEVYNFSTNPNNYWKWKLINFKTAPTIKAMMQKIVAEQGKKGGVSSNQNSGINSEIHNVIAEQNVTQDGKKGMKIHVDFIINNAKDVPCRAIAYFYDENKNALKDKNDKYNDTGGNVCAGTDLTPSYENTHYSDLTIFIPYEELHIDRGDHNLKFFVRIWKKDGDFVDNGGSEYYQFSYSASKNMENNLSKGYWRTHMNRVMDHFTRWYFGNDVYKGQETTVYYVSMRNGLGVYKWENGTYYWGEWMQGDMNGYGIYICRDGYTLTDCPNCVYYVGNYRNDNRSGKGSCYDEYGNLIYYGDFYNGRPTGTYPTTGNYSSYKFECIEYDNGNKYVGETKDGKRQGYGIFLWKNGEAWYGPWNNGIRDGYGIDLQYNGSITYGRWLNDTYYRY